jgi:hypothetical protein
MGSPEVRTGQLEECQAEYCICDEGPKKQCTPPRTKRMPKVNKVEQAYTASLAYGEPYLADVDFGTSTSHSHLAFNTAGL